MGLLDDAIREHLELKRLMGADPGVVAREEQDALGPVRSEGEAEQSALQPSEAEEPRGDRSLSSGGGSEGDPVADSSTAGQETIEINMEAELAAGADSGHGLDPTQPARPAPVSLPADTPGSTEESLEWEVPSARPEEPEGRAKSEDETNPLAGDDHESAEQVEDVLEETPDFLRDTPEQERLWFEQRPPRDFDFNE